MAKAFCLCLLAAPLLVGCSDEKYYEAVFVCPGADPHDLVMLPEGALRGIGRTDLVRSVAEDGKLALFMRSELEITVLGRELSALGGMPAGYSLVSIRALPDGLPPKPEVVYRSEMEFRMKRAAAAQFGVSMAELRTAVRALAAGKDLQRILDGTLVTNKGNRVRIRDLVDIATVRKPSHVIRDHP
jgi:hypothetical protein